MKRIAATILLSAAAAASLFAENAFWVGNAPYGASWSNEDHYAFTNLYTEESLLTVTSGDVSINVEVKGSLPTTLENRDFGLTEQALKELGLWGNGGATVSVKLRKGSILEDSTSDNTESGWFTLTLGSMEGDKAMEAYKTLVKKGFKPQAEKDGDLISLSVAYIVDYEKDEAKARLEALGYPVTTEEPAPNPYL